MTDGVGLLAAQFDTSLEFFWERMEGLTDAEYLWEPAANSWSLRPRGQSRGERALGKGEFQMDWGREPKPAPMRTIAWLMWHLAAGCLLRSEWTIGGHTLDVDDVECPMTADGGLALLRHGFERYRAIWDEVPADEFAMVGRSQYPHGLDPKLPLQDILWWQNREVIHHCAEMSMLRDLYTAVNPR